MINLLVPSRGRPSNIIKLIENINEKVSSIKNVNILIAVDSDDIPSCNIAKKDGFINVKFYIREKSDYLNRDYYNWLAEQATADYLWAIGDDVRFYSSNWDILLKEKIEKYLSNKPDRIAYFSVCEQGSQAKHPCFPIITKEAFMALKMYFHPTLMSWGADRCLYEVYQPVNRVCHIPEICIEHMTYHDGKAEFDVTAKSMKERFFRDPECHNKVTNYIVPQQIKFLNKILTWRES